MVSVLMMSVPKVHTKTVEDYLNEFDDTIKIMAKCNKVQGMDEDDVAQELRMTLLRCYELYDETKGVQFNTYFISACKFKIQRLRRYSINLLSLDKSIKNSTSAYSGDSFLELLEDENIDLPKDYMMDKIYKELDNIKDGELVRLYYIENVSSKDIAKMIGKSTTTVFNRINKVLDYIKDKLDL